MKIETKNELAALIAGIQLGNNFDFAEQSTDSDSIIFGDWEACAIKICKSGKVQVIAMEHMRDHWAISGALADAQKTADEVWNKWSVNDAVN
tara:strand:- start:5 stop:280 length:276 start_codon:yes stop_codon:yes gene_type:complete